MNVQTPTVALPAAASLPNMPDVINSLKRLERIGAEESQTVQKILEAASELSAAVGKSVPESLLNRPIVGCILTDGSYKLGSVDWGEESTLKHNFGSYSVVDSHLGHRLHKNNTFVAYSRDVALDFAKDVSLGLLDVIALFIETEHEVSEAGLASILSASDLLKAHKKQ